MTISINLRGRCHEKVVIGGAWIIFVGVVLERTKFLEFFDLSGFSMEGGGGNPGVGSHAPGVAVATWRILHVGVNYIRTNDFTIPSLPMAIKGHFFSGSRAVLHECLQEQTNPFVNYGITGQRRRVTLLTMYISFNLGVSPSIIPAWIAAHRFPTR